MWSSMTARMSATACPLWHRPTASTYEITHKDTHTLAPLCPCSIISLSLPLVFLMHANRHAPTSSHLRHAVTLSSIMVLLLLILTRPLLAPPAPASDHLPLSRLCLLLPPPPPTATAPALLLIILLLGLPFIYPPPVPRRPPPRLRLR